MYKSQKTYCSIFEIEQKDNLKHFSFKNSYNNS